MPWRIHRLALVAFIILLSVHTPAKSQASAPYLVRDIHQQTFIKNI